MHKVAEFLGLSSGSIGNVINQARIYEVKIPTLIVLLRFHQIECCQKIHHCNKLTATASLKQ